MKKIILVSSLALACALPAVSHAESNFTNPAASTSTASGKLDFTVVVPSVLFLRIGTGGVVGAAGGLIDSLTFTVPAANIGDGTVITATGSDLPAGAVTVRVFSNFGSAVNLNSSVAGPLLNVAGDAIGWAQITVAQGALAATTPGFTNTGITHPAFSASSTGGAGTAITLAAAGKLVRQEGTWTFSYSNTAVVPAGAYGTSARNGRVTYTATQV